MGTIDQPKPTEPKATSTDPQPLQPGGQATSNRSASPSTRVMPEADDALRSESDRVDDAEERLRNKR